MINGVHHVFRLRTTSLRLVKLTVSLAERSLFIVPLSAILPVCLARRLHHFSHLHLLQSVGIIVCLGIDGLEEFRLLSFLLLLLPQILLSIMILPFLLLVIN